MQIRLCARVHVLHPYFALCTLYKLNRTLCHRSAILGITVLAVGNSVADWVADVAVSRAGEPGMAVAACFGAPMFAHAIGLSIALLVSHAISFCHLWFPCNCCFKLRVVALLHNCLRPCRLLHASSGLWFDQTTEIR